MKAREEKGTLKPFYKNWSHFVSYEFFIRVEVQCFKPPKSLIVTNFSHFSFLVSHKIFIRVEFQCFKPQKFLTVTNFSHWIRTCVSFIAGSSTLTAVWVQLTTDRNFAIGVLPLAKFLDVIFETGSSWKIFSFFLAQVTNWKASIFSYVGPIYKSSWF